MMYNVNNQQQKTSKYTNIWSKIVYLCRKRLINKSIYRQNMVNGGYYVTQRREHL